MIRNLNIDPLSNLSRFCRRSDDFGFAPWRCCSDAFRMNLGWSVLNRLESSIF